MITYSQKKVSWIFLNLFLEQKLLRTRFNYQRRAGYRYSHPCPLVHTQLLWLRCVLFCLLSSPQIYCQFCWQRYFCCFQNTGWESPSRTSWEKFISWLSIYFEFWIYPSVYFYVSLFFQCVRFSPLSHFPPYLSGMLALVPVNTWKKKARSVLSLGTAQRSLC